VPDASSVAPPGAISRAQGTIATVPTPDRDLVRHVREALATAGDPERAASAQAYMKSAMPFRGVAVPAVRSLVRTLVTASPLPDGATWRATVLELWDPADFREERYAALAVARHPRHRPFREVAALDLYEHLVRSGAWWDLVDEIATHLVGEVLLASPGQVAPVIRRWASADDLWVRRAAVLCQVGSGDRCDQDLLAETILANLDGSTGSRAARSPYGAEFFVRKGIGWALRDHARTEPGWVASFVDEHADSLSGLTRREALKHLR